MRALGASRDDMPRRREAKERCTFGVPEPPNGGGWPILVGLRFADEFVAGRPYC